MVQTQTQPCLRCEPAHEGPRGWHLHQVLLRVRHLTGRRQKPLGPPLISRLLLPLLRQASNTPSA
jgi:hypothetical protein